MTTLTDEYTTTKETRANAERVKVSDRAHAFVSYLCTKWILSYNRTKENDQRTFIHIPVTKLKGTQLRYIDGDLIPYDKQAPTTRWKAVVSGLVSSGIIERKEDLSASTGRKTYSYRPLIDPLQYFEPSTIVNEAPPLNDLHTYMANCMRDFKLSPDAQTAFIMYLNQNNNERAQRYEAAFQYIDVCPNIFFKVDSFASRVHTPFSSMETVVRPHIEYDGKPTASIDVATSQPIILGEILEQHIPHNEFTQWTRNGLDVYQLLADRAQLDSRKDGKALFFQLIFSPPKKELETMFPNAAWVQWLTQEKTTAWQHPKGDRYSAKVYNRIAYLLQHNEAKMMGKVWEALKENNIPFLSVHDEVIVPHSFKGQAYEIMSNTIRARIPCAQIKVNKGTECLPTEHLNSTSAQYAHNITDNQIDAINQMNDATTLREKARQWASAERIIHQAQQQ